MGPKGGGVPEALAGGCMLSDATYTPPVPHTRSERNHPASSGISRPDTASTFRDVTLESMVFTDGAGVSFSISRSGRPRQRVDPCVPLYVCAQAHQLGCASALVKLGFCSRNMRGRIR